jgi:hypothetical protein
MRAFPYQSQRSFLRTEFWNTGKSRCIMPFARDTADHFGAIGNAGSEWTERALRAGEALQITQCFFRQRVRLYFWLPSVDYSRMSGFHRTWIQQISVDWSASSWFEMPRKRRVSFPFF